MHSNRSVVWSNKDVTYFKDNVPIDTCSLLGFPAHWKHYNVLYGHCCVHGVKCVVTVCQV